MQRTHRDRTSSGPRRVSIAGPATTAHHVGGFTLIELLVVIAIIALLVSILVPSLKRAKDLTKTAVCSGRVRNFGSGLHMYTNDENGKCPWSWNGWADTFYYGVVGNPWSGYGGHSWALMLLPYTGSLSAYRCPSRGPGLDQWTYYEPEDGTYNGQPYLVFSDYHANPNLGAMGYGPSGLAGWTVKSVVADLVSHPSEKVFTYDNCRNWSPYGSSPAKATADYWVDALGDGDRSNWDGYSPTWGAANMGAWHEKGTNVAFMDGHAERLPYDSTKTFYDTDETYWDFYK